jgi:hypothetical protein
MKALVLVAAALALATTMFAHTPAFDGQHARHTGNASSQSCRANSRSDHVCKPPKRDRGRRAATCNGG